MNAKEFIFLASATALGVAVGYLVARQVEVTLLKRA